jgi:hypothetical protein
MSPEYQQYYQDLLTAFHTHENANPAEPGLVEACFKSSLDHWGKVCKLVRTNGFKDCNDEIRFFRDVKPAFAAFIEYYTYRYHALLFAPVSDVAATMRFWRWEERKMKRFFEDNREFCNYMREGATHLDNEYFLRAADQTDKTCLSADLIHDPDAELTSPKDPLVTIMRAYELYGQYIETKLLNHLEA